MIERDGWYQVVIKGSHRQYKHATKPGRVTVAGKLSDDLAPGTLNSILKQAGLKGRKLMRYAVVIEQADGNLSAYVPDLPGCVATGESVAIVEVNIRDAIRLHVERAAKTGCRYPSRARSRTTSMPRRCHALTA